MANSLITVTGLTLIGALGGFIANIAWAAPDGLGCLPYMQPSKFEIYASASPTFGTAAKVGETTIGLYTQGGLAASTTRYVWVRAVDPAGNPGPVYPAGNGQAVTTLTTQPPANSVGSGELQNGAVTGPKIAAQAVGTAHIDDAAITRAKIGSAAIGSAQIDDLAVTGVKIANGAISAPKISVASLDAISANLGNVSINGNLVVAGTINAGKLVSKGLFTENLADGAVSKSVMTGKAGAVGGGGTLQSASISVPSGFVSIDFNALLERPNENSSNFGYLACRLFRNGTQIATWVMFYDDNFAYPIALMHRDEPVAGTHTYTMTCTNQSGAGQWTITDSTMRLMNFKV